MAKKSGKNVYLVALLLFLGGVGYLAYPKTASISSMSPKRSLPPPTN